MNTENYNQLQLDIQKSGITIKNILLKLNPMFSQLTPTNVHKS
jgi:hypothetical protein